MKRRQNSNISYLIKSIQHLFLYLPRKNDIRPYTSTLFQIFIIITILPLLSQIPGVSFSDQEIADLTKRIQNAGTEVVEAKAGGGSATLSMGQAAARFGLSLVRAMQGEKGVVECAYVEGDGHYARFFSQPLLLGKNGVEERQSIGKLSAFEQQALEGMLDTLKKDIALGEDFVNK